MLYYSQFLVATRFGREDNCLWRYHKVIVGFYFYRLRSKVIEAAYPSTISWRRSATEETCDGISKFELKELATKYFAQFRLDLEGTLVDIVNKQIENIYRIYLEGVVIRPIGSSYR